MAHPDLQIGARGADVRVLQQLVSEGLQTRPGLARDGVFGPLTEAALRRFQQMRGLEIDGVAGPLTWAALSPVTRAAPAPTPTARSAPPVPGRPAAAAAPRSRLRRAPTRLIPPPNPRGSRWRWLSYSCTRQHVVWATVTSASMLTSRPRPPTSRSARTKLGARPS